MSKPKPLSSNSFSSLTLTGPETRHGFRNAMGLAAILSACGFVMIIYWSIEGYWRATDVLAVSEVRTGRRATPTLDLRMVLDQFLRERTWAGKRQVVIEPARLDAQGAVYYVGRDSRICPSFFGPSRDAESR